MPAKISVDKYLKIDLFKELELDSMTHEQRASFLESFGAVIQQRLTFRLMEILSDAKKERLEFILASDPNNDTALGQFLSTEVPNLQSIAEEEIAGYKKQLIDRMKA